LHHQGSCGGSLLLAFRKASSKLEEPAFDLEKRISWFEGRVSAYQSQMHIMADLLDQLPRPIFGYGAGLMLATFAYHLKSDLSLLESILDDDPEKHGTGYQNLPVHISNPAIFPPPPDSSYLITSLENLRPIIKRISGLQPRRVLVPPVV
jgi:hypothetical protein